MVSEGQVFKNYLELCKYLGEEEKHGASRKAQLRKWECLFSWHNKGHQIIIDEVYEDGEVQEFRGGNNDTHHVDVMYPYVQSRILGVDPDEYLGTQRLLGSVLHLIPMNAYKQINDRGMKTEDFYKKHGLEEIGSFEEYVSVAGIVMKDTVVKCLRRMQKNRELKFAEAEVFIAKDGRRRYLCIDGYDELVKQVEVNIDYILALVKKYHDEHCLDKEAEASIMKAVDSSIQLRSKKELIQAFLDCINVNTDVDRDWETFVLEQKDADLDQIIKEERLRPEATRKYIDESFETGTLKTSGTAVDAIMPPVSRFGGGNRAGKKQGIIDKLRAFYEKYFGLGIIMKQKDTKPFCYDTALSGQQLLKVADEDVTYGLKHMD